MVLTIDEKEKLLEKATKLYNEIENIKIRRDIKVDIERKYYPNGYKYSGCGFTYYYNGRMSILGETIEKCITNLKNYINFKKYDGKEYINGYSVAFLSDFEVNALLDFICNGDYIVKKVKEINEKERNDIDNLLN